MLSDYQGKCPTQNSWRNLKVKITSEPVKSSSNNTLSLDVALSGLEAGAILLFLIFVTICRLKSHLIHCDDELTTLYLSVAENINAQIM